MKRILWALVATAGIVALTTACMPAELSDAELTKIADEKAAGSDGPCPPDDPGVICCDHDQICRDAPDMHCFEPRCEKGRCIRTLDQPLKPGTPCVVPMCTVDCVCSGPIKGVPDSAGHCVPK